MRHHVRDVLRSRSFGIVAAVVFVGVAASARWALTDVLRERSVFLIFLPAVAVSAYLWGAWPGIVATLLGAVGARLLMPGASTPLPVSAGELLQLSLFLVTGAFISLLTEKLRGARAQASHMLDAVRRDATARQRAEDRLTAEHAVTRILAGARSLGEAAPAIVQAVRASLHARVGAMWLPDESSRVLRCAEVDRDAGDERSRAFTDGCRAFTFARG